MKSDLTLLYIEDDIEILQNITLILNKYFKKIYKAQDGEEALKIYSKNKPDILLTDIVLPKLNGLAVATEIRDKDKKIPIIFLSAYRDKALSDTADKLSSSSFLVKPFALNDLEMAISKAIYERSLSPFKDENSSNIKL